MNMGSTVYPHIGLISLSTERRKRLDDGLSYQFKLVLHFLSFRGQKKCFYSAKAKCVTMIVFSSFSYITRVGINM